jgi:hypothetical protein
MATPIRLIVVTHPTINPSYRGHYTTYLYEETKMPPSVLRRMKDLPDELSWMELIVGNLRLDPAESVRIQGELERACLSVHRLEDLTVPYHVVSVRPYPGNPSGATLPWAIRITVKGCELDSAVYLVKALPERLIERIVKSGLIEGGTSTLGYDPTNYTSVLFGDVPDGEKHLLERQEILNAAEIPKEQLYGVVIALERTYLSH